MLLVYYYLINALFTGKTQMTHINCSPGHGR